MWAAHTGGPLARCLPSRVLFQLPPVRTTRANAGYRAFHPTVLVGMCNKLRASARPRRLFEDTKVVARQTGAMKNRARVLDWNSLRTGPPTRRKLSTTVKSTS